MSDPTDEAMLWMGDIEPYMDAEFISYAFRRMGETVLTVKVVYDKYTGLSAGYCFLQMTGHDACRRAMLNVQGKVIPKSRPPGVFNLCFANSPNAPFTEYNLMVGNLPDGIDDKGLFEVFGTKYASCRGAKVYKTMDGVSKGNGFVRFTDQAEQQAAIADTTNHEINGQSITLKLCEPKFNAPRGSRYYGDSQYDSSQYYGDKDYSSVQSVASEQQMYAYNLAQQSMQHLDADGAVTYGDDAGARIAPPKRLTEKLPHNVPSHSSAPSTALSSTGDVFKMPLPPSGRIDQTKPLFAAAPSIVDNRHNAENAFANNNVNPSPSGSNPSSSVPYQPIEATTDSATGVTMLNPPDAPLVDGAPKRKQRRKVRPTPEIQIDPSIYYEMPDEDEYDTIEETNYVYFNESEHLYRNLDSIRFPQKLLAASVKTAHL